MGFSSMSLCSSSVPACLPFFFFLQSAEVVVAACTRTVGAYQSGHGVLSDEDHVPLSLAVVNMCRCITGRKREAMVIVPFYKKKIVTNRKNTIILR